MGFITNLAKSKDYHAVGRRRRQPIDSTPDLFVDTNDTKVSQCVHELPNVPDSEVGQRDGGEVPGSLGTDGNPHVAPDGTSLDRLVADLSDHGQQVRKRPKKAQK